MGEVLEARAGGFVLFWVKTDEKRTGPTIRTNRHWRDFVYRTEVPEKVLKDQFDYQDAEEVSDGFLEYLGCWYHLDMFMRVGYPGPFGQTTEDGWQGSHNDSFFSGVVIRLSDDGEQYQIGTFYA